jgi:His-Xaa-Ser system protein HxsD
MARDVFSIDNMTVNKSKNNVIISVNPKVYGLDTIFSAAYIFIDKAYVIVDGDPNEEIVVQLKAKDQETNLEKLGRDFNNELINYSFYGIQTARSMPLRAAIIQRAFKTQIEEPEAEKKETNLEKIAKPLKPGRKKVGKSKHREKRSKRKR